jgi:malonyl-CoA O-methyltransferase
MDALPSDRGAHPRLAAEAEFEPRRSLPRRLPTALARRAAWVWHRVTRTVHRAPVEAAWEWLASHAEIGLPVAAGDAFPSPAVTGGAIATAVAYGQDEVARSWATWLASIQLPCGAFPDSGLVRASIHSTGEALAGAAAVSAVDPGTWTILERAADWLASQVDREGRLCGARSGGSLDAWSAPAADLPALAALDRAATIGGCSDWSAAARRGVRWLMRTQDLRRWDEPLDRLTARAAALVDLGHSNLAQELLVLPAARQRSDGAVPALPESTWVSAPGQARLAAILLTLGDAHRGGRAFEFLLRRQRGSGGFAGSWGVGARYFPRRESTCAVLAMLEATLKRVASAFGDGMPMWPDEIAASDGRLVDVNRWAATLSPTARIADVGCGAGRYLRRLAEWLPGARLTGIDVAEASLRSLAGTAEGRKGSMLRLPAADGEFDAVLAVESLEHALMPRRAVRELCRVVRPGGHLLIIDKDVCRQSLSRHEPWERWFAAQELCDWLREDCEGVACRPISHGGPRQTHGLFLAASGQRRMAVCRAAA